MKKTIFLLLLCLSQTGFSQSLPGFLAGTWKVENSEIYEHWDKLNETSMKGFSYKSANGITRVTEYLDIVLTKKGLVYTATVVGQNKGKGINFRHSEADSVYTFENPKHDFPKKIVYRKISDSEIDVQVSDGGQKGFAYKMLKQVVQQTDTTGSPANKYYDAALAERLGADDYGMKGFLLVILKTGSNQTTDRDFINESFRGHLDNINRLVKEDKLIVAGPLGKNERNYRGIFILHNIQNIEDARELLQTDPAIKAGLLDVEIYNWYGSAALPVYLEYSDKIWKVKP
jgi:uncharacterized protein YciI